MRCIRVCARARSEEVGTQATDFARLNAQTSSSPDLFRRTLNLGDVATSLSFPNLSSFIYPRHPQAGNAFSLPHNGSVRPCRLF